MAPIVGTQIQAEDLITYIKEQAGEEPKEIWNVNIFGKTLEQLVDDDSELISLYYGQDVTEEEADAFTQEVEKLYPDIDVDVHCGGQPIYYYVLAVE